jgi:hypothetical protein
MNTFKSDVNANISNRKERRRSMPHSFRGWWSQTPTSEKAFLAFALVAVVAIMV